jgi:hypothetical protein
MQAANFRILQQKSGIFLPIFSVIAFIAATKVNSEVFNSFFYSINLKVYFSLAILSFTTTSLFECILNIFYKNQKLLTKKYYLIVTLSGLALTIIYGPKIFINFYEYDDWMYMSYSLSDLSLAFINSPINEHYIPLLKLLLYYNSKFSDPTFFGYSLLFYMASMLVLNVLARFIIVHIQDERILAFVLISFSVWPSFETARTWFGGGFWLAIPVATLLLSILLVRKIITHDSSSKNFILLFIFSAITVLISSQILIPIIFIYAYLIPYLLYEKSKIGFKKSLLKISIVSFIPSLFSFLARPQLPTTHANFFGFIDGSLFRNIYYFIDNKILLIQSPKKIVIFLTFIASIFLLVKLMKLIKNDFKLKINNSSYSDVFAFSSLGLTVFLMFVIQVGLGRGWDSFIVINPYYSTMPITGICIVLSALIYLKLKTTGINRKKVWFYWIILILISSFSFYKYYPNEKYIKQVMYQKEYIRDFGEMTCSKLAGVEDTKHVYLKPKLQFSECKRAEDIFKAPKTFVDSASISDNFFIMLAIKTSSYMCGNQSKKISRTKLIDDQQLIETEEEKYFYKKYYHTF